MRTLVRRVAAAVAGAARPPVGSAAVVGAIVGAAIAGGGRGALASAAGVAAAAAIGGGIAALVRWRQAWYWKVTVGVGTTVAIVVVVILYAVGVIFEGGGKRTIPKQTTPDRATRVALERRFAPVLRLNAHRVEPFVPIDRPAYVAETQLKQRLGSSETIADDSPTVETLPSHPCTSLPGCVYFLDVLGAEPDPPEPSAPIYHGFQEQALRHHRAQEVVYAHVRRYVDTGDYAVQYWFLYFFNYRLNEHESDWEQITIQLDPKQQPVNAFYSAHVCGHVRKWKKIDKRDGEHPVDYVALGSHANYFKRGHHPVALKTVRLSKSKRICIFERAFRDVADGQGIELRLDRDYKLRELTGPVFTGSYGSGNYVLGKRTPDVLSDPRTRREWIDSLERLEQR